MKSHPPFSPFLILGLGILAVSAASIMIRFAQQEAPSLVIAAWRLSVAALVLAPSVILRRRGEISRMSRADLSLTLLAGIFLVIHFATWITSLAYTSVASSVILVTTSPLWVALFSPLVLKEKITRYMAAGLGMALLGGVLVGLSDVCTLSGARVICPAIGDFMSGKAFWGDLLALIGAFAAAGYLMIGRKLRSRISTLSYIFLVYGAAAVGLVLLAILFGQSLFGYSRMTYLWMIGLALIPQLIGHSSYNWALAYLPAAFVSLSILGEPIGSSILAYFIFDEMITILQLAGSALILGGLFISSRARSVPQSMIGET
jgi:drug/metabolite transporter (DMT)-like permease